MIKTKAELLCILFGIAVGCLLISNILGAKTFTLGSVTLPTAVIIFPVVYIVNDLLAEVYGFKTAAKAVLLGFVMNLLAVVCYTAAIALPAPAYAADGAQAFATTLGSTPRVLVASFLAYLVGSMLNAFVMVRLKERLQDQLMFRCISSTLVGEGVDAMIFISIAFYGLMPTSELLVMIAAQALFKTAYECVVYPATRTAIGRAKALPE